MTVKVKYNINDGMVLGYYPSTLDYSNCCIDIDESTIDGSPYIEVSEEEHLLNLGKVMVVLDGIYQEYIEPLGVRLALAKSQKITTLKTLRDYLNMQPMVSHQAKELIREGDEFTEGELVYFVFDTKPTSNPATEPSSICFTTVINGMANPTFFLKYSCKIVEGEAFRDGYIALTPAVCTSIMGHAESRNTQNIMACNDKEKLINACTTLEELALIDVSTLV